MKVLLFCLFTRFIFCVCAKFVFVISQPCVSQKQLLPTRPSHNMLTQRRRRHVTHLLPGIVSCRIRTLGCLAERKCVRPPIESSSPSPVRTLSGFRNSLQPPASQTRNHVCLYARFNNKPEVTSLTSNVPDSFISRSE